MAHGFDGALLRRGDHDYEAARCAAVWNARTPDRFPAAIVRAASEADAVAAVRLAREEDLRITVRSGGHSWSGSHLRDGGLLLDLSALREATVNPAARTATVQPGCRGNEAMRLLGEHGLFFPGGHCVGVALGGYLLQGGFGWNGRVHGPACMSVAALDVVTADGELVHASEDEHPDLLWAARGAGPGFFGVVTRFHLRCTERPPVIANALHTYALDDLETVFRWAHELGPRVPRAMELMVVIHRDERGEAEVAVTGPVIMDTEEEAREALALLGTCPAPARMSLPYLPVTLEDLYAGVHAAYPDDHRYAVDNLWTHAPVEELLPGLRRIAETLPAAPSHMLWMNWGPAPTPAPERPDMAYSVEDDTYIAVYGIWDDPARDAEHVGWATDRIRELEHLASGIQLADENLVNRPARFLTNANAARLEAIRERYDPHGRFHRWLADPEVHRS